MRRNRPTVVVHADLAFLAGGEGDAELDVLGPVSREVARRLACDAKVLVSADDPYGHSLNLGRTRRDPSDAQRIEIRRRDKGCRFPGCTHTEFTDVHHVLHWTTAVRQTCPTSSSCAIEHHRFVHEMGWKIRAMRTSSSPSGARPGASRPRRLPPFRGSAATDRLVDFVVHGHVVGARRHADGTRAGVGGAVPRAGSNSESFVTSSTGRPNPRATRPSRSWVAWRTRLRTIRDAAPPPVAGTRKCPRRHCRRRRT